MTDRIVFGSENIVGISKEKLGSPRTTHQACTTTDSGRIFLFFINFEPYAIVCCGTQY